MWALAWRGWQGRSTCPPCRVSLKRPWPHTTAGRLAHRAASAVPSRGLEGKLRGILRRARRCGLFQDPLLRAHDARCACLHSNIDSNALRFVTPLAARRVPDGGRTRLSETRGYANTAARFAPFKRKIQGDRRWQGATRHDGPVAMEGLHIFKKYL